MIDTYGLVFRKTLYPLWESRVRKRPTLAYLKELERTQWCSLDELTDMQGASLARLLRHAYDNVPYYRRKLDQAGVIPSDLRRLEDLACLPLLSRDDAQASHAERRSKAAPFAQVSKMTSGTSGCPLAFAYDWDSEYWRQATKLRGYSWAGYRPGDKSLHFWGTLGAIYDQPLLKRMKADLDHRLRREHYIDCTDRSAAALDRVIQAIRELRPSVILCYAQAGAALARHVVQTGRRDWDTIPVICGAERMFPADRASLVEAFGPEVYETYGSREVMLMAAECSAHEGMHVSMENLIVELVVRDHGGARRALPGEIGEVVVTDLHNHGAPFIRYVTGDLAIEAPPGTCACGRALTRLMSVEGRVTDTLRDAAGNPVSGLLFNVIFSVLADKVQQFQVVQKRDRTIELKLVPGAKFDDGVLDVLKKSCRQFLPGVGLHTELVPLIPLGKNGKRRVVVVEQ
jgi:phenylacetate-CoA ligase